MAKDTVIFWFRRDLRLQDNKALYHALLSGYSVQPIFIFDRDILDKLQDKDDARVTFILETLEQINKQLAKYQAALACYNATPLDAWKEIIKDFAPTQVYYNNDYEPAARTRDTAVNQLLESERIAVYTYKDQVIFEKDEILKADGKPYTVYTPYRNCWTENFRRSKPTAYAIGDELSNLSPHKERLPTLQSLGFERNQQHFPPKKYEDIIDDYKHTRDFPSKEDGTSHISIHLRFGTLSIRDLANKAADTHDQTWLGELIWREFYMMILWHFPDTVNRAFKKAYDNIQWRNNEEEFAAWCTGKTGYPIVDAGMRQLNKTGFMHNRVRMIAASFLCKHLLIDWRWGEAYFARRLHDYEQSSNVGNWQWAAGSGNDAAPYFRIFNPELQVERFDKNHQYIKKWVPEYADAKRYVDPIVDHKKARERALETYKKAVKP